MPMLNIKINSPDLWEIMDGRVVTSLVSSRLTPHTSRSYEWDGRRYKIRSNRLATDHTMVTEDVREVASAHRVGCKGSVLLADGRTYEFQSPVIWRREEEVYLEDRRMGSIKQVNARPGDTSANLSGLPILVQIFALVVVTIRWHERV
jgi:hypothetical protein